MKWNTGTPPKTEFCQEIFFVRIESPEIGCKEISFTTHVWYGTHWSKLQYKDQKITHWAYIEDPVPIGRNIYEDTLGRIRCVVQEKVLPNLQTPPAI